MVSKKQFAELQEKVLQQEKKITSLQSQVASLDFKLIQINAEKALSSHINNILVEKLDDLSQYVRRPCIVMEVVLVNKGETDDDVVEAVKNVLVENLGFEKESVNNELDKAHHIGPVVLS